MVRLRPMYRRALSLVSCVALLSACPEGGKSNDDPSGGANKSKAAGAADAGCDLDKVAALAGKLGALDTRARRDAVMNELGDACTLPEVLTLHLQYSQKLAAARDNETIAHGVSTEALTEMHSAVCSDAAAVFEKAAGRAGPERSEIVYDRCELGKFDLIDFLDYRRLEGTPLMPFYASTWMKEQGVPDSQARTLGRALLLLSRRDYGRKGVEIPTVAQAVGPISVNAEVIWITKDAVQFKGNKLAALGEDGRLAEFRVQGLLIGALYDRLDEVADNRKAKAKQTGGTFTGELLVAAHAGTPYDTVKKVAFTAGRAFDRLGFIVQAAPLDYGVVSMGHGDEAPRPRYSVQIEAKGFSVTGAESIKTPLGEGSDAEPWDWAALAKNAAEFKVANPNADGADVQAAKTVPFDAYVRTIAVLRGPECGSTGKCLFKDVR